METRATPARDAGFDESRLASRLQLPPGPWTTLIDGLCARFPRVSREAWLGRLARGQVRDSAGQALVADAPYRAGLEIRYFREVCNEVPVPFQARIVHLDDDLLVADKPHFLPVMPAGDFLEHTLLRRLQRDTGNPHLVPLHRLDRLTAGLVMFSVRPATRDRYQALFRDRQVFKRYQALASPSPRLTAPTRRASRLVAGEPFFRMREEEGPANSLTDIEPLEVAGPCRRYLLTPLSGKKHQLRVHMAALGAPILNDDLYPELRRHSRDDFSSPLALLACELQFIDPLSQEPRRFLSGRELSAASVAGSG